MSSASTQTPTTEAPPWSTTRPSLDVLSRLAERHAGCALVLDALEHVASRRDRAIVLEVRVQMASGDPPPLSPWLAATA